MPVCVSVGTLLSVSVQLLTGVKQGCVIAPILFTLFFAAMLDEALSGSAEGILIRFRTDGGIFKVKQKFIFNLFAICFLLMTVASSHTLRIICKD